MVTNLTADTLDEVTQAVTRGIDRVHQTPHLPFSFLRHGGLAA
jgi:hypothetical protein